MNSSIFHCEWQPKFSILKRKRPTKLMMGLKYFCAYYYVCQTHNKLFFPISMQHPFRELLNNNQFQGLTPSSSIPDGFILSLRLTFVSNSLTIFLRKRLTIVSNNG